MYPLSVRARPRAPFPTLLALGAFLVLLAPGHALAAKGGGKGSGASTSSGLTLVSQYVQNSPNPAAPTWCLNEDDWHQRNWSGSLSGTFTATEQLCDASVDYSGGLWWDAGGIGLQVDLWTTGALSDLTITSPQGDSHHAVLVGSSTTKGATTDHYQACYVPAYSMTYDTGGAPLPGGTWQFALSGNLTNVRYTVDAQMADVTFQQSYCPTSEQNLVP